MHYFFSFRCGKKRREGGDHASSINLLLNSLSSKENISGIF
jgi:hypothetical protein